jgi:hypothetical protein
MRCVKQPSILDLRRGQLLRRWAARFGHEQGFGEKLSTDPANSGQNPDPGRLRDCGTMQHLRKDVVDSMNG